MRIYLFFFISFINLELYAQRLEHISYSNNLLYINPSAGGENFHQARTRFAGNGKTQLIGADASYCHLIPPSDSSIGNTKLSLSHIHSFFYKSQLMDVEQSDLEINGTAQYKFNLRTPKKGPYSVASYTLLMGAGLGISKYGIGKQTIRKRYGFTIRRANIRQFGFSYSANENMEKKNLMHFVYGFLISKKSTLILTQHSQFSTSSNNSEINASFSFNDISRLYRKVRKKTISYKIGISIDTQNHIRLTSSLEFMSIYVLDLYYQVTKTNSNIYELPHTGISLGYRILKSKDLDLFPHF